MRHQRPDNFGRKDSPIAYDRQGKPRMPAPVRTGYAGGGSVFGGGQVATDPAYDMALNSMNSISQLSGALGVMQQAGYGPASRGGGFDPEYYLKNNPGVEDAARAFGMDPYQGAYTHYDLYGRREGRAGSAPRTDTTAAAAPQSTLAGLTPVGGGGAAPSFNANADLAAQQATGAATLAQMRGGNAPGALTAPAVAPTPKTSFTPSATGNAGPPVAMAGGGAVGSWDPVSESYLDPSMGLEKIPTAQEAERRHQARMGPDLLKDRDLTSPNLDNMYAEWEGTNKKKRGYAGGGMVEDQRNPMDPISDDVRRARGENSVSYGFEKIPSALELKQRDLLRFPLEENLPESYNDPLTNDAIRANKREGRKRFAGGGMVEELGPRQSTDPQSMIPPAGGGPALNRFGMNRGRTQMKRGYAQGGEVDDQQSKAEDTYVTGDQLAKQVEERFSQALETDDKYRRGYDDGGYIPQEGAATGYDPAAAEEARRIQEEIERQRMAEAAAEAEREAARRPAPEQAPPADERRTDPNDTSRLLPEPPALPPEDAAPQPAASPDGVPSPAQPAAVADAQAQAEQQTNDWLSKVIDYSHSKVDPAEYGPPQPPQARTGYAPEEATGPTPEQTGAPSGGGRGPMMASMLPALASMAAPGPATPPDNNAPVSEASGWGELLGAGAKAIGKGIVKQFARDPVPEGNTLSAAKMSIADLINGKDAVNTPEQLGQVFERDPYGDHNARNQRAMDALETKGDLEGAHRLSQAMRGPFNGSIAFARAANASDRPDAVARMLDHAHNFLTNKTLMKTVPTNDGYDITLTSEKDGSAEKRFLTKDQMTDFLNSNGVQYDAMAKNSTLKHLDIAAGRRGQFNTDISSLPVSDERTGYTPQEPPMTQGAPRTSDYTTVPPPAPPGAAAPAPAPAPAGGVDPEKLARATAHIPREGTPATGDEIETAKYMLGRGRAYPPTMEQIQDAVEQTRTSMRTAIEDRLRPRTPSNANPLTPMTVPLSTGYKLPPGAEAQQRHPAWEGLQVADKWEAGQGYKAPSWPNMSAGPENYGMFPRASGPAHSGITLGRNEATQSVGPYIPAGGDQGALRIPPGGKAPPGWRAFPAEDAHEGSGQIALPPGVAPNVKDVTMYRSDGTPVAMKVPDFWDPNKIKYQKEGRDSGQAVFPNPPGTKYNERGDAVRPISSYASTLATPAPGREPGAPAPIARGGQDFGVQQPWRPQYGPGTAGPPPPDSDTSPDAVAARRYPSASQAGARAKEATTQEAMFAKADAPVRAAEARAAGTTDAATINREGAMDRTQVRTQGAMDRTQANIAGRATAASEKFDHEMKKLETREGGLNDRAAMRDATNRYKIETISSDKGREIAQKALTAQQMKDLSIYQTKIANGQAQTPAETDSYNTFREAMVRNGFRVPPDDQAPAPAPAQAAPAAQAPAPGRGRLTVPLRGGDAGAAVNETARGLAGGQATAASATPPGQQPAPPGQQWLTNPRTGEHRLGPVQ